MPDTSPQRAVELHEQLRRMLTRTMGTESPVTIAGALMYELTSLAAAVSTSEADAVALIDSWAREARLQIRRFGVGSPHP